VKIIIIFFIVILLSISVIACSSQTGPSSTSISSAQPSQTLVQSTQTIDWNPEGIISPGEYQGSQDYNGFQINWRTDSQYIYLGFSADTTGWLAVAFQPGSRMKDADMLLGLVRNGKVETQDAYSLGDFGPHKPDIELGGADNILASGGKEEGNKTTLELKRLLVTGDKYDLPLNKGVNKIIWAIGPDDNFDFKHSNRGYGEIVIP
jgi:hypothetical protein